ncbi:MFS transporter [Paenibacillus silviterrae]|uniref:MFS transporter n=1 Tax=Paenibacillus silviterrae TaxID=3242194 RepID=UPI002542EAC7|nr:MFS transporter [Paenibacillus chinjuensis]
MDSGGQVSFMGMRMGREAWHNFRWDFAAASLFSLFNVVFNQFYIPLAIQQGASDFQVGLLAAAPAIGLTFSPLWSGFIQQGAPKWYFFWPNLIGRSLIIIPVLFYNSWVFVGFALFFHLLMGIQAPAYASLMTRIYPAELRGRLMGNVRVVMGLLMIPLAYVIGQWIDSSGGSGPLMAAAVSGFISVLAFLRIREIPSLVDKAGDRKQRVSFADQWHILKGNRGLLLFLTATTISGFGNMLASPLYSIIQVSHLGLSNLEIGYIRMSYFTCLLLSYFIMGWVIDRYSPRVAMCFGTFAYALVPLLYGLGGTYPAVIAAGGLQGFGDAIWDIGCMAYVFRLAPGREAVVFGLHLMLFGIRGTIGPLLSTSLGGTVSFELLLLFAAGCAAVGCLLFVLNRVRSVSTENGVGM